MRFEWLSFAIVKNNLPDLLYVKTQVAKVVKREDQLVYGSLKSPKKDEHSFIMTDNNFSS